MPPPQLSQTASLLVHLVLVASLTAAVVLRLVGRHATRALAGAACVWGSVLIAAAADSGRRHAASLEDFLLFRATIRDVGDFLHFDAPLVLGYGCIAGAVIAMPWLARSSIQDLGHELRQGLSVSAWHSFFAKRAVWLIAALIWVLWLRYR